MENLSENAQIIEFKNDLPIKEVEYKKIIAEKKEAYLGLVITGIDDKEGYIKVYTARKDMKVIRVGVEKFCKSKRDELNDYKNLISSKEKEIVREIEEVECKLQAQTDVIDLEKERLEKELINSRLTILRQYSQLVTEEVVKRLTNKDFNSMVEAAKESFEKEQDRIESEAKAQKEDEEKRERQYKRLMEIAPLTAYGQKVDNEILHTLSDIDYQSILINKKDAYEDFKAAEKAKSDRQAAVELEQAKIAKQQEEDRKKIEAEKMENEAEKRKIILAEEKRLAEIKRVEEEKIQKEKFEEEKKIATEKAVLAEKERVKREAEEKENEAKRKDELAPDKEKLEKFIQAILDVPDPLLSSVAAEAVMSYVSVKLGNSLKDFSEKIKDL